MKNSESGKTGTDREKSPNLDPGEVDKFDELAHKWWDEDGEFKALHDINPLRVSYIKSFAELAGQRVLDVGCGGGILTEALAKEGARVTGTDMAKKPLQVAKLHQHESGLCIDYELISIEEYVEHHVSEFDVVTCLEVMEHVPDPGSIVKACRRLLKPNGKLFLSTINRNPKAYLLAVLGAEYLMKMVPKGTHDYARFIKPSEMATWLRREGFDLVDVTGMTYNPITKTYRLSADTDVNYLAYAS